MKLEELTPGATVRGVVPNGVVTIVGAQWFGSEGLELTYKTAEGRLGNELLYRHDENRLELVATGRPWSFDGDGHLFRLVSEAHRIRLAHLFDPLLAVHTSLVEPLPHQITAVYEAMLPRQPLRYLLADDPGAGKTIMAGLLIKELIARGDLQRCLVVCPGSLAEQWQDELWRRFQLPFDILTNDKLEAARTGNWFSETPLVIARLDKLSRNEDVQAKLQGPEAGWDLVVFDEAHKLSATCAVNDAIELLIRGRRWRPEEPGFMQALAGAYDARQRPLCMCRDGGIEMYVARLPDSTDCFIVKRMPETGCRHAPGCPSYEPPPDASGLGQVLGTAIVEDPATGETTLKLDFALSKMPGRSTMPSPSGDGDSAASSGTKLSLRALLH